MKYIDITPAEYRCPSGDCPSVKRAEDGSQYRVTGKVYGVNLPEATIDVDARLLEGAISVELAAAERINAASARSMKEMLERIAALETALKPFAKALGWFETRMSAEDIAGIDEKTHMIGCEITVADLVAARAALSKDTGHE